MGLQGKREGRRRSLSISSTGIFLITLALAMGSMLIASPGPEYLSYFDLHTLIGLFAALATVTALERSGAIESIGFRAAKRALTLRGLVFSLVSLTALTAMFVSNDLALLVFLPLSFWALRETGNEKHLALVFVLEAAAANLGGMLLPFGSPQNLFLFSYYEIPFAEFVGIMALPVLLSLGAITLICALVPGETLTKPFSSGQERPGNTGNRLLLLALLLITAAVVLRIAPLWTAALVPLALLFADRCSLREMDWGLLGTVAAFFVLVGNLAQIEAINSWSFGALDEHLLLWSVGITQVVSNVPTAMLLSQFTDSYREILLGVNIGGAGTIVASLANLIALFKYQEYRPGHGWQFMVWFSAINAGLLLFLLLSMTLAGQVGLF
jgi:Na+/H+ antiporter NhaD/arsenite permease-like protein